MTKQLVMALFGFAVMQLTGCGHVIAGKGYGQLVDYDCKPVKDTRIHVGNRDHNSFLHAGHVTTDEYMSDKEGFFDFNIETSADEVVIYLPNSSTEQHRHLRGFKGGYAHSEEKRNLLITAETNRIKLYPKDTKLNHQLEFQDHFQVLQFGEKVTKGLVRIGNTSLHFNAVLRKGIKTLKLSADKGVELAEVKAITNHNIEVSDYMQSVTLTPGDNSTEYTVYMRGGSKKTAAIIRVKFFPLPDSNSIAIKSYAQSVSFSEKSIDNTITVELEGCGGAMARGVYNRNMALSTKNLTDIKAFNTANAHMVEGMHSKQTGKSIHEWLDEINYVTNQKELDALLARPEMNESLLIKLLQYDIIKVTLFDNLYPVAEHNQWEQLIRLIGSDPRVSEGVIIDIVNNTPPDNAWRFNSYIKNLSAKAGVIAASIRIFESMPRKEREHVGIINAINKNFIYNQVVYKSYEAEANDIKTIQSFYDHRYIAITDNKKKYLYELKLKDNPYASSDLLEKAYYHLKTESQYHYMVRGWALHPNTTSKVLTDIYLTADASKGGDYITAILNNPNASPKLRRRIYLELNTNKSIANSAAAATNIPEKWFLKIIDSLPKNGTRHTAKLLLQNPSLSLNLSERLVASYGCIDNVSNETYAKAHFQQLPDERCYVAALKNNLTPMKVKYQILAKRKVRKNSYLLKMQPVPAEHMRLLYCGAKNYVLRKMSENPYTPEDIFWDMLENSGESIVIDNLAANSGTPVSIIERIYNNDYVAKRSSHHTERSLSCNTNLPNEIRKYLKYIHPFKGCSKIVDLDVIQHIRTRDKIDKPINCSPFKDIIATKVLPEIEIIDFGIIEFIQSELGKVMQESSGKPNKYGKYEVIKSTSTIIGKQGVEFGIIFVVNGGLYQDLVGDNVTLDTKVTYPGKGLMNPKKGLVKEDSGDFTLDLYVEAMLSETLEEPSDLQPGKWTLQLGYKGTVVVEKTFIIK